MINLPFEIESKNPWWDNALLIETDDKIIELKTLKYVYTHPQINDFPLNTYGVMTLRGPRQIGKTTLVKQIIQRMLLKDKVAPENIFYYSCDGILDFQQLNSLLQNYFQSYGYKNQKNLYIFLDEISFVADWQRTIKIFAESEFGKRTLFFLTGSSTIDLEFSSERLPGRRGQLKKEDVFFLPLTFYEFLFLVKPEIKKWLGKEKFHFNQIRQYFRDYLLTGGFPTVINEYYDKNFISSNLSKIYLQWVFGDMHKLGKSDLLTEKIINKLIISLTTPLSYYEIAKTVSLASHSTAFEYLDYLERLFCLFRADCFIIPQKKIDFKKNHKFYFYDQFILFSFLAKNLDLLDNVYSLIKSRLKDSLLTSKLIENIVASHLKRNFSLLYYGKYGKKEVDFVAFKEGVYQYFEVKYQDEVSQKDLEFINNYPKEKLTVISKNTFYEDKKISILPLEVFLLRI